MITLLLSEAQRLFFIRTACEQLKHHQERDITIEEFDAICDMSNHELFQFTRYMDKIMYG